MGIFDRIIAKVRGTSTASSLEWSELETELLGSDLGPALTAELISAAKKLSGDQAQSSLESILSSKMSSKNRELAKSSATTVVMIVGVNGTGKTTSVAKLAKLLADQGSTVVLAAADTFRAAAVEQLSTWGSRLDLQTVTGRDGAEPASVAFDAAQRALALNADYLLIDTAGRLHNKNDLMAELTKIKRVVEKIVPLHEVLLVIDGTTGQNALAQAEIFSNAVGVTGLIVTKLDGSARGGVALAIEAGVDIPIKFVGTGEAATDFQRFDAQKYLSGLL